MNENQTLLQLGDFVCPRYYAEVLATTTTEQANVYQVIEIREDGIVVAQNVFNPVERISASEDFFTKFELININRLSLED